MRRVFFALLVLLLARTAPLAVADPVPAGPGEYVLVTGGVSLKIWEKWKAAPHDGWWMNFVRAARLRINEIQAVNPAAQITWLVYRPAYVTRGRQDGQDYFSQINSVRDTFHVKLIYFDRTAELITYLNTGQDRHALPICDFEYFGHSNKACFLFDYSNNIDSASKVWLHEKELGQLRRGLFTRDAFVKSWGCHSGELFAKRFFVASGSKMIGAKGKTQYMDDVLPILSSPGGYWMR